VITRIRAASFALSCQLTINLAVDAGGAVTDDLLGGSPKIHMVDQVADISPAEIVAS